MTDLCKTLEWTSSDSGKKAEGALSATQNGNPALENAQVEVRQWSLYKAWDNTATPALNRIPPVYPPPGTSEVGDKIRARRGQRGLTPLDGALLNAPELAVSQALGVVQSVELNINLAEWLEYPCRSSAQ